MRLLLDTHTLVWWSERSRLLSTVAAEAISDADNTVMVSTVSAYEMALKHRLGKWPEVAAFSAALPEYIAEQRFTVLPLTLEHAQLAGALAVAHKDPWDRMLIAQALAEEALLVSNEQLFDQFGVRRVW